MAAVRRDVREDRRHLVVLNWRDVWHPEGGGSELYMRQVCERLVTQDIDVTIMTARYPGSAREEIRGGVRYVRRGGHLTVYLWAALMLLTGRLGRVDRVLEVQNGMPFLATWFTRSPVVVLVHHVHREQWPVVGPVLAKVGWLLESKVAVRANRHNQYVAVSAVTRGELVDLGVDPRRIRIAFNGMPPLPKFQRLDASPRPSLAVLSRLVPHKQIEHAIEVLPGLVEEFPGITLDVIGSGWWSEHLVDLTRELGLEDRVRFHGHVSDSRKFELLSQAWVHVLPSLKEGWGLSIIEAAAVGVPSVAYWSAGGVQESILDGVTGYLADDQVDLARVVSGLLADDESRLGLGEKAAARAEQFTWDATTTAVLAALDDAG